MAEIDPKNPNTPIKDEMVGKNYLQKSELKTHYLSLEPIPAPYNMQGFGITIESIGREGGLFRVVASAKKAGKDVLVDNPLLFQNPPVLVPTGKSVSGKNERNEDVNIPTYKEDLQESIKIMVAEAIRATIK